jgi:hypothetical protein
MTAASPELVAVPRWETVGDLFSSRLWPLAAITSHPFQISLILKGLDA